MSPIEPMNCRTELMAVNQQILAYGTGTAWFKDVGNTDFDPKLVELTKTAIQKGYYHLDCAEMYGTEDEVGVAIKDDGVARQTLFITNKVAQGIDEIPAAIDQSLKKMQLDYFDLQRAWKAMEELKKAGKAKSIGVSNYTRSNLEATLKGATDPPVINQIEYHAYLQRSNNYIPWMREHGIQVASFKGLTPAFRCPNGPLKEPLSRMAKAHNTTEAVVLLSWLMQNNVVAVTTTTKPERLDEYAQALKIKLGQEDLDEITNVGATYHFRTSWGEHFEDDDRS
ncbi:NAD/NADP-dependent indole-3-acetaldehyde reductase [Lachnellula hyalina]|uniref:NAD/NADP-dependent indole-3-acetaldehyde reductase n=1 Tax=Lachnellula hyalina TaxID=1316788 RepID=A0A8H8QX62_9HELO|nr:NAD/NADP-dependent indole-3-acetaldehyde reductase [Lachnellula hyalina]TVY24151.1 NAD/NADP-dependent indole-3-acetaldehyde reductase [Lachnellula hyalina]